MLAATEDQVGLAGTGSKPRPKTRPAFKSAFYCALELQEIIMQTVRSRNLKPNEIALLSRAYKEQEELKLRVRMKGPPKAVDPLALKKPKAKPAGPGFAEG